MRRWATSQAMRDRTNPVPPTTDVINRALGHYADHSASCYANDGSGDTEIGRGLYPTVPDMRATNTQSLTDGELFSIIEHGIRLTGERMESLNPKTPAQFNEEEETRRFLRGNSSAAVSAPKKGHQD